MTCNTLLSHTQMLRYNYSVYEANNLGLALFCIFDHTADSRSGLGWAGLGWARGLMLLFVYFPKVPIIKDKPGHECL